MARLRLNICKNCDTRDWLDAKTFYEHSCTKCGTAVGLDKPDLSVMSAVEAWPGGVHRGLGCYLPPGTSKNEMKRIAEKKGKTIEFDGRLVPKDPRGKKAALRRELHQKYGTLTHRAYMSRYGNH